MAKESLLTTLYTDCKGYLELRALQNGRMRSEFYLLNDTAGIKGFLTTHKADDVYFAVATRDGKGGKKDNIVNIPAVYVDIDYKEISEAEATRRIEALPLKPTITVKSGGGLHCYWRLREPADKDDIGRVESIMRALAITLGGDMASTDASRILRVPGTKNYKYKPARPVVMTHCNGSSFNLSDFEDVLPVVEAVSPRAESSVKSESLDAIMQCAFMAHCRDDAAILPEPLWYAMITQLAKEPGGVSLIHKLSKPHKGYKVKTVDEKILHALDNTGPMKCERIKALWNCEQDCGVKSPAALAFQKVSEVSSCKQGKFFPHLEAESRFCKQTVSREVSRNLAMEIRLWIEEAPGTFHVSDIDREFDLRTREEKNNRSKILNGMVHANILEHTSIKKGHYRIIDSSVVNIDFKNVTQEEYSLWLPFALHRYVKILPGNILVFAGEPNVGKTAVLLNIVANNMAEKDITYFSSEMGAAEFRERLIKWEGLSLDDWHFDAYERSDAFHQVIRPEGLNIVDFLEVHDEFYKMGGYLREIHDKLTTGICIVAIQKNRGADFGLGGGRGLEKPRLYVTLSADGGQVCMAKIAKAKNYIGQNPNGKQIAFTLTDGWKIEEKTSWHYPAKERE